MRRLQPFLPGICLDSVVETSNSSDRWSSEDWEYIVNALILTLCDILNRTLPCSTAAGAIHLCPPRVLVWLVFRP